MDQQRAIADDGDTGAFDGSGQDFKSPKATGLDEWIVEDARPRIVATARIEKPATTAREFFSHPAKVSARLER